MNEVNMVNHGKLYFSCFCLVLADVLYIRRRVREDDHSAYDTFTVDNMKIFVMFCKTVMKVGAHGHVFRSALQLAQQYQQLVNEKEKSDDMVLSVAENLKVESTTAKKFFHVYSMPFLYSRARGI